MLAQKLAQRGPVLSGHLDRTVARIRSFTKALNRTVASCNSLNKRGELELSRSQSFNHFEKLQ